MPTPSELRALHRAFVLRAATRRPDAELLDMTSPRFELVQSIAPHAPVGRAGLTFAVAEFHRIFEPIDVQIADEVAGPDACVTVARIYARHVGKLGPLLATGRRTIVEVCVWSEFEPARVRTGERFDDRAKIARSFVEANSGSVLGDLDALRLPPERTMESA